MPGIVVADQNPFREAAKAPPPADDSQDADTTAGGDDEDIDAWEAIEAAQVELMSALKGLKRAIDDCNEDGVMDFLDAAFEALSMMQDALDDEDFLLDFDFVPMQEETPSGLSEASREGYRRPLRTKRGAREHVKAGQAAAEKKAAAIRKKQSDLIDELKKNPKVRNPAALAAWIGMRLGGLASAKKEGK